MSDGFATGNEAPFELGPGAPAPHQGPAEGGVRRVVRNSAIMGATAVISKLLTVLFTVIVIRKLQAEEFGLYGFAFGFVTMFGVFFDLGLRPLLTREIVRGEKDPSLLYGNYLLMKFGMAAANLGVILLVAFLAGYGSREWNAIAIVAAASAVGCFFNFNTGVFNAFERMEHDTAVKLTWRLLTFLGGWGALIIGWGIWGLLWVWLLGGLVATVMSFVMVRWHLPTWKLRPDFEVCKTGLKDSWPIWGTSLFIGFYMSLAIVLLKHYGGDEAVARYNMPFQLIYSTVFVATAILGGVTPLMFREARRDPDRLARIFQLSMKWVLLMAIPLALGGLLFAEPVVLLINPVYSASVPSFRIQSLLVPFLFLNAPFVTVLVAVNEQRKILVVEIVMAAAILLLNLALIPSWGAIGASWSIVFCHLVGFAGFYLYTARYVRVRGFWSIFPRPIGAAVILLAAWLALIQAGGSSLVPGGPGLYLLAVSVAGAAVYLFALFLTGSIEDRERAWFLSILGRGSRERIDDE